MGFTLGEFLINCHGEAVTINHLKGFAHLLGDVNDIWRLRNWNWPRSCKGSNTLFLILISEKYYDSSS